MPPRMKQVDRDAIQFDLAADAEDPIERAFEEDLEEENLRAAIQEDIDHDIDRSAILNGYDVRDNYTQFETLAAYEAAVFALGVLTPRERRQFTDMSIIIADLEEGARPKDQQIYDKVVFERDFKPLLDF